MFMQMFRATRFMIAQKWKQSKCPSPDEWINKMGYIHTTEYYSTIKMNGVLIHTTMWINHKLEWSFNTCCYV